MQTFLPYPSFTHSAQALDNRRLGKQLVEVQQIFNALNNPQHGYRNHPAVLMWRGYQDALIEYGTACYLEWFDRYVHKKRGGKARHKSGEFIWKLWNPHIDIVYPFWLGGPIHATHRAALKHKDPVHYAHFEEAPEMNYYWPT